MELYRSKLDLASEEKTKKGKNPQEENQKKEPWKKPRADTPWHTQSVDACKRPDTPRPDTPDQASGADEANGFAGTCTVEECPEIEFVEERRVTRQPSPPGSPPIPRGYVEYSPPRSPPTSRRYVEYNPDEITRSGRKRPQSHRRGRGDSSERDEKRSWRTERKESRARSPQRSRPRYPDRSRREHRSQDYRPRHLSTTRRR